MQRLTEYFDRTAHSLDRLYFEAGALRGLDAFFFRGALFSYWDIVFREAGRLEGRSVLDVGCGPGFYLKEFARRGAKVTGVDVSRGMLNKAQKRTLDQIQAVQLVEGDIHTLDIRKQFDLVIAIGVADYVDSPSQFLSRLAQLSRDMVIVTFPLDSAWARLRRWRYARQGIKIRLYSEREIRDLSVEAGLSAEGIIPVKKSGGGIALVARRSQKHKGEEA